MHEHHNDTHDHHQQSQGCIFVLISCSSQSRIPVLIYEHHPYTGNLNREMSGDSKNAFLHWEDVLDAHHATQAGCTTIASEHTFGLCLQVISALSVACSFLLVRTVFGLLSIDHHQYSNDPKLLYTLEVLPEMIALYIVAIPGFIPGIGRDAENHLGIAPTGTHASPLQVKMHHKDGQMGSEDEASHQGKLVSVSQDHPSHDHVIDAHPRASDVMLLM